MPFKPHVLLGIVGLVTGCASSDVIPESLEPQVDKTVTIDQLMATPDSYKGKVVVLGGEVLKTKGLREGTQLEILQLPLEDSQRPTAHRPESQGRFLALSRESPDPATFAKGTVVTIVGEVTGAETQRLDETEYRYPTLDVKHLYVWPDQSEDDRRTSRPWWGVFGGVGIGGRSGGGGVSIGTGY